VACDIQAGWQNLASADDPVRPFLDLYLPLCGAGANRPVVVGHLGQSLDGFIATLEGESQWITGHEDLLHMHRLRAICEAVVVGAGTVAADDPQLTTRLVDGPNPVRVVLDPARRLGAHHRVFTDACAPTLYLCARPLLRPDETRWGQAEIVAVEGTPEALDPAAVLTLLRTRGCRSVFVEGGGITVSRFLAARLLDRLHVAVAPLIIGEGRRAIRLAATTTLDSCHRPPTRVFRMGGDVLFDCDMRAVRPATTTDDERRVEAAQSIARVY
jgi:riboflavin-specific deaminase-like protein